MRSQKLALNSLALEDSREDIHRLGDLATPEMLAYLSADIANNAEQGMRNQVSDVKLLQGDVSEAWREVGSDYATVAMRYAIHDVMVDKANGKGVPSPGDRPTEVTEFWTFRRDHAANHDWQLSAIQQAA